MDRIQIQAAVVVTLFDQFTGKAVLNHQAWIEVLNEQKVINKGNGCYVFLCPFVQEQKMIVHSHVFWEKEIILSQAQDNSFTHQMIWLEPKENYPYPLQTTYIKGSIPKSEPSDQILIFTEKDKKVIRLAQDYVKGEQSVSLYGIGDEVQGTCYAICKGKDVAIMDMMFAQKQENRYLLREPLQSNYKKTENMLHRVYKATVDQDGLFFVALPGVMEDTTAHILLKKAHKIIDIKAGKMNVLT